MGPVNHRRHLSAEVRSEIISRYLNGERDRDLAAEFGVSRSAPRQLTVKSGQRPRVRARRRPLREDAFATITPESAYWVGMLMADGCVMRRNYIRLGLAAEDGVHIIKFQRFLGTNIKIEVRTRGKWKGMVRQDLHVLTVGCRRLHDDLHAFGIVPRKSRKELAPDSLSLNRDFWRGVIDGDGSIFVAHNKGLLYPTISLCNGGTALLEQFITFVRTVVDVNPTIHTNKDGVRTVVIGARRAAVAVIAALYDGATVALDRKAAKAHEILQTYHNLR